MKKCTCKIPTGKYCAGCPHLDWWHTEICNVWDEKALDLDESNGEIIKMEDCVENPQHSHDNKCYACGGEV